MNWGLCLQRLWSDLAGKWVAKGAALLGILIISFGNAVIGGALVAASIAWIILKVCKANARRGHLARSLGAALVAHGEVDAAPAGNAFPDVPLWIGRDQVYWTGKTEVAVQPLAQLVWAYAEKFYTVGIPGYKFGFCAGYQIVLWNRDAVAIVLPVHKSFRDASMNRIAQTAPWMAVGYTVAMAESWNADHADFLALVASHREEGKRFELWAGSGTVLVPLASRASATSD